MLYCAMKRICCHWRRHRQCPRCEARALLFSFAFEVTTGIIAPISLRLTPGLGETRVASTSAPAPTSLCRLLRPRVGLQPRYSHIQFYIRTSPLHAYITAAADRHMSSSIFLTFSVSYAPYICLLYLFITFCHLGFFFYLILFFFRSYIISPPDGLSPHLFVCFFTPSPFPICHICLCRLEFCCIYSFSRVVTQSPRPCLLSFSQDFIAERM